GTVQVTATSTDSASAITMVRIERAPLGSTTWTALCTDTVAPYACSWDTTTVTDGDYQLRATSTDAAGFSATSSTLATRVANAAEVVLTDLPGNVRGTIALSATVSGAGSRTISSAFQFRLSGTPGWTTITGCSALTGTAPTCSWSTTALSDVYDVRVLSVLGSGTTTAVNDQQLDVVVDNTAPTVTITAPSPMAGTVQVTSAPLDDESGIAKVDLSYRLAGATTFTALCTVSLDPYRCNLDTTKLTNLANYELRAITTDVAGNSSTPALITRQVQNGVASVTITSPTTGDQVRNTTTITTDTSTPLATSVTRVVIESRPVGGTFATICTDTTAPYSCDWATAALATGTWELRAVMTYTSNLTATSPIVTVTIDNSPLRALDIQARNSGTLGTAGAGDTLTFTYQGAVNLTTIAPGFTGASTAVNVVLRDKNVNPATATDRATIGNLGTVVFTQNYVRSNKTVTIPATMTATTSTSAGTTTTVVTVLFGTIASNDLRTGATSSGAMRWTPTAAVQSTSGVSCSTTTAVESGVNDSDL
ncbi:MAG: Ig-like domain-containing protein, partial [Nocardioides sp.]